MQCNNEKCSGAESARPCTLKSVVWALLGNKIKLPNFAKPHINTYINIYDLDLKELTTSGRAVCKEVKVTMTTLFYTNSTIYLLFNEYKNCHNIVKVYILIFIPYWYIVFELNVRIM